MHSAAPRPREQDFSLARGIRRCRKSAPGPRRATVEKCTPSQAKAPVKEALADSPPIVCAPGHGPGFDDNPKAACQASNSLRGGFDQLIPSAFVPVSLSP